MPVTLSVIVVRANATKPLAQFVLAFKRLGAFLFLERMPDFGPRARGDHVLKPIFLGRLLAGGDDFDLVSTRQRLA